MSREAQFGDEAAEIGKRREFHRRIDDELLVDDLQVGAGAERCGSEVLGRLFRLDTTGQDDGRVPEPNREFGIPVRCCRKRPGENRSEAGAEVEDLLSESSSSLDERIPAPWMCVCMYV